MARFSLLLLVNEAVQCAPSSAITASATIPDYPDPTPSAGEALVRVRLAGICNTDLELIRGYMGFRGVLGHEFVGEVVAAPDPTWVGRRVVATSTRPATPAKPACAGRHTHCPNRTTLGIVGRDGAFADYLLLPLANLVRRPGRAAGRDGGFRRAAGCRVRNPRAGA